MRDGESIVNSQTIMSVFIEQRKHTLTYDWGGSNLHKGSSTICIQQKRLQIKLMQKAVGQQLEITNDLSNAKK